ncbi:hypothetical protein V8D89_014860 [Ganoderma adspersum]
MGWPKCLVAFAESLPSTVRSHAYRSCLKTMSSLGAAECASFVTGNYCIVAASVLVLYEAIITTGDNVRFFWGRKLTGASVLFWLNKWLAVLCYAFSLASNLRLSDRVCAAVATATISTGNLLYLVWGSFTALRIYALWKTWILSSIILLLSVVPVGLNMSHFHFGLTGVNYPVLGCVGQDPTPVSLEKLWTIVSRTCLILTNCLAIIATWFATRKGSGFRHVGASGRRTLAGVPLWDGLIYFLILTTLDCLHMIITLLSINELIASTNSVSYLTQFTIPLSAILVSRFMLHLQSANARSMGLTSSQDLTAINDTSLLFDGFVGSLGAAISPDNYFGTKGDHARDDTWEENSSIELTGQRNTEFKSPGASGRVSELL